MKKLSLIFLSLLVGTIALAASYEGEIDPDELLQWEAISTQIITPFYMAITAKNPDEKSEIKRVRMIVFRPTKVIIEYGYFLRGKIYAYNFDGKENKYVCRYYSDQEKRACLKCHKDLKVDLRI